MKCSPCPKPLSHVWLDFAKRSGRFSWSDKGLHAESVVDEGKVVFSFDGTSHTQAKV